jgi:hypothetical protein
MKNSGDAIWDARWADSGGEPTFENVKCEYAQRIASL